MRINRKVATALTLMIATSQVFTGCKSSKAKENLFIEYADQISTYTDKDNKDCITSSIWLPLNQLTNNQDFREAFEATFGGKDLVYTNTSSTPTMQEILRNTTFISNLNSIETSNLLESLSSIYLDIDETTSPEVIKAASLSTYFKLFSDKSEGEFNSTQRISRQDFLQAFEKSTHSPSLDEQTLSEKEIASLISGSSYLGNNTTNNTEQGKITKVEAAYLIYNSLFNANSKAEVENIESRAKTLQDSLDTNSITDNNLQASLDTLEAKGIIDSTFTSNWNKTITKTEAINLIFKALEVYNTEQGTAFEVEAPAPEVEEPVETTDEANSNVEETVETEVESTNDNYNDTSNNYSEPENTYSESENTYNEPENNYTEPEQKYEEPAYTPPAPSSGKVNNLINGDDDNSSYDDGKPYGSSSNLKFG